MLLGQGGGWEALVPWRRDLNPHQETRSQHFLPDCENVALPRLLLLGWECAWSTGDCTGMGGLATVPWEAPGCGPTAALGSVRRPWTRRWHGRPVPVERQAGVTGGTRSLQPGPATWLRSPPCAGLRPPRAVCRQWLCRPAPACSSSSCQLCAGKLLCSRVKEASPVKPETF